MGAKMRGGVYLGLAYVPVCCGWFQGYPRQGLEVVIEQKAQVGGPL